MTNIEYNDLIDYMIKKEITICKNTIGEYTKFTILVGKYKKIIHYQISKIPYNIFIKSITNDLVKIGIINPEFAFDMACNNDGKHIGYYSDGK